MLNSPTDKFGYTMRRSCLTTKLKPVRNMISAIRVEALSFYLRLCCSSCDVCPEKQYTFSYSIYHIVDMFIIVDVSYW